MPRKIPRPRTSSVSSGTDREVVQRLRLDRALSTMSGGAQRFPSLSRKSFMERWKLSRNKGSIQKDPEIEIVDNVREDSGDYTVVNAESPPVDVNMVFIKDSFEDVSEEALRVKIVKEQLRYDLLELMRSNGGNVRILEEIETGTMTAETLEQTYGDTGNTNKLERNIAFLWSAFMKRKDFVETLLNCGADIDYCEPNEGFSALHLSAFSGCVASLNFLISRGGQVNYALRNYTPLHSAAFGNSVATAQLLINNGARTSVIGSGGDSVCGTAIHSAIKANSVECVQLLAKYCSDINSIEPTGVAPIHVAADLGHSQCLQVILDVEGVDVNVKNKDKKSSALHLAAETGNTDCLVMLLLRGAEPDSRNNRGQTPLHLAAKLHVECVETLLKTGGCDPNAVDNDKRTPLHCAVGRAASALEIVEILVSWRADVNKKDKYGYTPLHIAALNELSQCVEALIYHGSNVTARTIGNMTALGIIVRKTPASLAMFYNNLDKAISMNDQEDSSHEVELKLDFRSILQHCNDKREIGFLNAFIEEGQKEILQHPLCEAFLHLKWEKIRRFYLGRLIFYMIFVLLLSSYVITGLARDWYALGLQKKNDNLVICNCTEIRTQVNPPGINTSNTTNIDSNCIENTEYWKPCVFFINNPQYIMWLWVVLMIFACLEMFWKIYGLVGYVTWAEYLSKLNYEDILDSFVLISVFLMSSWFTNESKWQNHVAAFAVLAAWINMMVMVGQLPFLGTYVAMYTKVLEEFAKLLLAYISLLIGFTISFCIIFSEEDEFSNPFVSVMNMLIMMTGEVMMVKVEKSQWLFISAHVIYVLFLLLVTIVLMNLLVGIAVDDIQGLKKTAGLSKLVRQTQLINYIERAMFNSFLPNTINKFLSLTALVSPSGYRVVLQVKPLNPGEKRLPTEILKSAYELAKCRNTGHHTFSRASSNANQNVHSLKCSVGHYQPKTGVIRRYGRQESDVANLQTEMEESLIQTEQLKEEIQEIKKILLSLVKSMEKKTDGDASCDS